MNIDGKSSVAEIAASLKGGAAVFESFGIDYSCAKGKTIAQAAREEGIDPARVVESLREIPPLGDPWPERSLTELARHLVTQHHRLLREELTAIAVELVELREGPGRPPAGLVRLQTLFTRLTERVIPHFHDEEMSILPSIESLESSGRVGAEEGFVLEKRIGDAVVIHGAISHDLRQLRELRIELERRGRLPERVGALLQRLAWLEAHLHESMFLENCLLLPRAIALEEELSRV